MKYLLLILLFGALVWVITGQEGKIKVLEGNIATLQTTLDETQVELRNTQQQLQAIRRPNTPQGTLNQPAAQASPGQTPGGWMWNGNQSSPLSNPSLDHRGR